MPEPTDARAGESIEELLPELDRRPLVYATLGTTSNAQEDVWSMVLEALAELDANVIAAVGRDLDPADFRHHPAIVRIERVISQALILPSCSAMLAHGGYGSLMGHCATASLSCRSRWRPPATGATLPSSNSSGRASRSTRTPAPRAPSATP